MPITLEQAEANALAALGDRYRWLVWPAVDHALFELIDAFADAARYMGNSHRVRNPGSFTFEWTPSNSEDKFSNRLVGGGGIPVTQLPKYGVGTTGDYWLRHLKARNNQREARISAHSGERPDRGVTTHTSRSVVVSGGPGPGLATELSAQRHGGRSERLNRGKVFDERLTLRHALTAHGEGERDGREKSLRDVRHNDPELRS